MQIACYVKDIEQAAKKAHESLGIGPFFIYRHIELRDVSYRGKPAELDHSSAYAQNGHLMIEFTQQNNQANSTFTDMYAEGEEGMHHVAMFVDNVQAEMQRLMAQGYETATHYFTSEGDVEVAFVDMRPVLGHMLELYEPGEPLLKFYRAVESAALTWDGKELFRYLN